jgi:hypothetical protein
LTDGPAADDIKFIQYKAKVGGKVVCLGNKCKNIQIEIWQIGDTQSTEKLDVPMEGTFHFNDILPAKYKCWFVYLFRSFNFYNFENF